MRLTPLQRRRLNGRGNKHVAPSVVNPDRLSNRDIRHELVELLVETLLVGHYVYRRALGDKGGRLGMQARTLTIRPIWLAMGAR